MNIQEKVRELIGKVKEIKQENKLPSESYFLNKDEIVCFKREFGDARYPYLCDGLTLWAYSSGNVAIEESMFNIALNFTEGKEPNLTFYMGQKTEDGYFPVSLTGAGKLPFERDILRYTVFSSDAAYYITETKSAVACVRMFTDKEKNIRFTLYVENKTDGETDTYLSSYFNLMLSHSKYEYIETKWYRSGKIVDNGFRISVTEYLDRTTCFVHNAEIIRDYAGEVYSTTSHTDYCGGMHNQLCCSTALQKGKFEQCKKSTLFTDTAIAGDIVPLKLKGKESFSMSYTLTLYGERANDVDTREIDELLYAEKTKDSAFYNIPEVQFEGEWKGITPSVLNYFIYNVFKQNEFCARAKNYAGPYIGIRDIFQQLESAQMWIPEYCRGKIIEALNFIGEDGRAPRQYSYPSSKEVLPNMDLRPFIDQGVWIISMVYNYLAQTNDFTVLDEECGYYKFVGNRVEFSRDRDSVLEHLLRIVDYLVSNLDEETGCLHALYGDWNDALDGLGKTEDKGKEYGNGVSVMATLQLYENLKEIAEILSKVGRKADGEKYLSVRKKIEKGLQTYAVAENDKGERKILHGWGENRSYSVAGFCDNDGFSRDGLTSNAFWIICGAIDSDKTLKKDILSAYDRLDSKYGLKTFEPYFPPTNTKVGRITRLPKGTAENGATYIHATLFGVWSLFAVGETERAWEQLYKILPITHEFISTTPFVMPNSYVENAEEGFDGESMSDWFTGSCSVLIKVLIWYVFGVRATLDGVCISPSDYMPFERATIKMKVKGVEFLIDYEKSVGDRKFFVNGKEKESIYDEKIKTNEIYFTNEELSNGKIDILVR